MKDPYLWNREEGDPDPFIERLERVLADKRYQPQRGLSWPRRLSSRRGGFALLSLLAAACLVVSAIGLMRFDEPDSGSAPDLESGIAYEQLAVPESETDPADPVDEVLADELAEPAAVTTTR